MELSPDFKVKGTARTAAEALKLADDIERAVGELMTGKLKPAKLDVGLLTGAVQALRDHVKPEAAAPQDLRAAVFTVLEGFTLPDGARKKLEAAYYAPEPASDPIKALVAQHARLIDEGNNYAYCEIAYTRQTGWMAWITDKPLAVVVESPDRKVLFKGQGDTPEDACRDALKESAASA